MGEEDVDGEIVTCSWYGVGFNVKTGAGTGGPVVSDVKNLPVKIEGDDVLVELN